MLLESILIFICLNKTKVTKSIKTQKQNTILHGNIITENNFFYVSCVVDILFSHWHFIHYMKCVTYTTCFRTMIVGCFLWKNMLFIIMHIPVILHTLDTSLPVPVVTWLYSKHIHSSFRTYPDIIAHDCTN